MFHQRISTSRKTVHLTQQMGAALRKNSSSAAYSRGERKYKKKMEVLLN